MRPIVRAVLISLVVTLGVIAVAEESWAAFGGGSRLIFYYTQHSIVNAAAAPGSAATLVGITNQSSTDSVRVRVNIFRGSTCANFGPVSFLLSPRRTLRLNVADLVSAASFPEGWVDVYAVDAAGAPIRWDQLSGKGTILDFGGVNLAVAAYQSAALFSDADRSDGSLQGGLIADNSNLNTFGALDGSVEFWGQGGAFGTNHRLIVIPVSTIPGTAPDASTPSIAWYKADETLTQDGDVSSPCMIASSLAALHPAFAATYPNDGTLTQGGNLDILTGGNKGFVGALFETATTPASLVVHPIQSLINFSKESHE